MSVERFYETRPGKDARRSAPAAARNTEPILDVLRGCLPDKGLVLEIASGAGEHAVAFAREFPRLTVQPSDADPGALGSIAAWRSQAGLSNLLEPVALDVRARDWPVERADAIICINMIHISPWSATEGLMRGAGRVLGKDGLLYLYGPYRREGVETAPSNEAFDESLKSRDPEWGLRLLEDVIAEAAKNGFTLESIVPMPANNLSVILRKDG